MTKRKQEQQDTLIDQAAGQNVAPAPVPQPVAVQTPQASTVPINPLTPPQPGMIPVGWMWPQQSAVAQAMDTGDVNVAGTAPNGGAIEKEEKPIGEDEDMLSDEEKDVINEYRKWKNSRVKEAKSAPIKPVKKVKEEFEQMAADSDVSYLMKELDISEEAAAVIASWYREEQADVEDMSQDELYDDVWNLLDAATNRNEYLTVLKSFDPDGYAEEIAEDDKGVLEEYRKWKNSRIKEAKSAPVEQPMAESKMREAVSDKFEELEKYCTECLDDWSEPGQGPSNREFFTLARKVLTACSLKDKDTLKELAYDYVNQRLINPVYDELINFLRDGLKESCEKKIEEAEEDEEIEPTMPEDVELTEPPVEDAEDLGDEEIEGDKVISPEEAVDELGDAIDELGDIVVDINELFAGLGGDLDAELAKEGEEDPEVDESADNPDEEFTGLGKPASVEEEEDISEEELVEKIKQIRKNRVKEEIKYPAGDPKKESSAPVETPSVTAGEFMKAREKQLRRRALIEQLREKRVKEQDAEEIAADATADPDGLDKEMGYDSVQSVIDKIGESRIKRYQNQRHEALDKRFLDKYEEKKQLNWKKLLENGLLG